METQKLHENIARAEDLGNLLDHIAWTDTVRPRLWKLKEEYSRYLTASVLGQKIVINTLNGPSPVSTEQIAARIDGINFIEQLFGKILTDGDRAFRDLQKLEIANS